MSDGRVLLVLLVTLAAGCTSVLPNATPSSSSSPDPRLVAESFDAPLDASWHVGFWDSQRELQGSASVSAGELRIVSPGNTNVGYGVARAIAPHPEGLVAQARVRAHALYRFGLYLNGGDRQWTGVDLDDRSACLCAWNGSREIADFFGPSVEPERDYVLRLDLRADGTAEARIFDGSGDLIAAHAATGFVPPASVTQVALAAWNDQAGTRGSDGSVASVVVVPAGLPAADEARALASVG